MQTNARASSYTKVSEPLYHRPYDSAGLREGYFPVRVQGIDIKLHLTQVSDTKGHAKVRAELSYRSIRIVVCFVAKNPSQQVGVGNVDMAIWLVVHFVAGFKNDYR